MNAEEKLLKVLSDHFEAATGRAVDMSAWSLDSLVRVLSSPNEVAALLGAFGSSRPAGVAAVEQQARYVVIGPPCRQPAKPFDFSRLELRVAGRLLGQPTTLIGLPEDIPPGRCEARIEGTVVSPDAGDVRDADLVEAIGTDSRAAVRVRARAVHFALTRSRFSLLTRRIDPISMMCIDPISMMCSRGTRVCLL